MSLRSVFFPSIDRTYCSRWKPLGREWRGTKVSCSWLIDLLTQADTQNWERTRHKPGPERGHTRIPFISRRYKQIYISLLHPHELAYVLIIFSHSRSHWNNLLEWLQYSPPGSMIWRWLLSTYQIYYIYNYCYDPNIVGMRYRWSSLNSTTVESLASCSTYLSDSLPNDSGLVGMDSVPTFLDLSHASIHPCASSWIT